jgi:hypothetical protein
MKNSEKNQLWIREYWRPMMAFVYMGVIIFDFVIGPIFWSIIQYYALAQGNVALQWVPLTAAAGGLFHVSMGAILGASAYTRGMEKIRTIENDDGNSNVVVEDEEKFDF